jgi:pyrroloquinoline quinone biosynthesis protein D
MAGSLTHPPSLEDLMNASTPADAHARYALNPMYLFRWEETQDAHVLLYPEGIVKLNRTAGEIIGLCDGQETVASIITTLQQRYPGNDQRVAESIRTSLEVFRAKGWIRRQA